MSNLDGKAAAEHAGKNHNKKQILKELHDKLRPVIRDVRSIKEKNKKTA